MARGRQLKPAFFTDGDMCEMSPLARLLFAGLWCLADREGRLEDKPKDIKIQILPGDDVDTDELLNELAQKFITRYEVEGRRYIQIHNFNKHQTPHKNEAESTLPQPPIDTLPPDCEAAQKLMARAALKKPEPSQSGTNKEQEQSPLYPCIPVSLNPPTPQKGTAAEENGFEEFWKAYPKKRSKGAAQAEWRKLKPSVTLQKRMLQALVVQKKSADWGKDGGRYIPYPATWLKGKRWLDDVVKSDSPDILKSAYVPMSDQKTRRKKADKMLH